MLTTMDKRWIVGVVSTHDEHREPTEADDEETVAKLRELTRPGEALPDPTTDPIGFARGLVKLEGQLKKLRPLAERRAVRHGHEAGMTATEIGAAIGRSAAHVHKILSALRLAGGRQGNRRKGAS